MFSPPQPAHSLSTRRDSRVKSALTTTSGSPRFAIGVVIVLFVLSGLAAAVGSNASATVHAGVPTRAPTSASVLALASGALPTPSSGDARAAPGSFATAAPTAPDLPAGLLPGGTRLRAHPSTSAAGFPHDAPVAHPETTPGAGAPSTQALPVPSSVLGSSQSPVSPRTGGPAGVAPTSAPRSPGILATNPPFGIDGVVYANGTGSVLLSGLTTHYPDLIVVVADSYPYCSTSVADARTVTSVSPALSFTERAKVNDGGIASATEWYAWASTAVSGMSISIAYNPPVVGCTYQPDTALAFGVSDVESLSPFDTTPGSGTEKTQMAPIQASPISTTGPNSLLLGMASLMAQTPWGYCVGPAYNAAPPPSYSMIGFVESNVLRAAGMVLCPGTYVEQNFTGAAGTYTVNWGTYGGDNNGGGYAMLDDAVTEQLAVPTLRPNGFTIDYGQSISIAAGTVGGIPGYSSSWYYSSTGSGACTSGTAVGSGTGAFSYAPTRSGFACAYVTDSAGATAASAWVPFTVDPALHPASPPTVSSTKLDADQALYVNATVPVTGTAPYAWTWLYSVNGLLFGATTPCTTKTGSGATPGQAVSCIIAPNLLTSGSSYAFELQTTDGSSVVNTVTTNTSVTMQVSAALAFLGPATDKLGGLVTNPSQMDFDQENALFVNGQWTGGWPWYNVSLLLSTNGGPFSTLYPGFGGSPSTGISWGVASGALAPGSSYSFELRIWDSASRSEARTSSPTPALVVYPTLHPPAPPTTGGVTVLDQDQALSVVGHLPSNGTPPFGWTWEVSLNGGAFAPSAVCATNGGSGGAYGALETCSVPASTLSGGSTYAFELSATDGSAIAETAVSNASLPVSVSSALTPSSTPSPNATSLDADQVLGVASTLPTTGTAPYAWTWLVSMDGGPLTAAPCVVASGTGGQAGVLESCSVGANLLSGGHSYSFVLRVSDSASNPDRVSSSSSRGTVVSSTLGPAASPSVGATALDVDQALLVTDSLPSSGTAPYAWSWYISQDSGPFSPAAVCATNGGTGGAAGAAVSCSIVGSSLSAGSSYAFELLITDSANTSETSTSSASAAVGVATALTAPSAPGVSGTALDADQGLAVSATIPSDGTPDYTWSWLVSVDGAGFSTTGLCLVGSGSGALPGATETCSIAPGSLTGGSTYDFEVAVADSASTPEQATSTTSSTVTVSSALTPPSTPTVSASALDQDQTLTVTSLLPATGTPTYAWAWLVAVNGGTYATASVCAVPSGNGATAGATESCSVPGGSLAAGSTYAFELQTTDLASLPETATSSPSARVAVGSALTAASTPSVTAAALDQDQPLTVTSVLPVTGSAPYTWSWSVSVNGAPYASAPLCAVPSGNGALGGASESCSVAGGALTAGSSYAFEITATDSATLPEAATSAPSPLVHVALIVSASAPTPASPAIDNGQSIVLTAHPAGGTPGYHYQWYATSTAQCSTSSPLPGATSVTVSVAPTASTFYCYVATDSASTPEPATSPTDLLTVFPALGTPSVSVSSTWVDLGQSLTFSVSETGGSGSYAYLWANTPAGCPSVNASTLSCTPSATGVAMRVAVMVVDSVAASASGLSSPFTIAPDPQAAPPLPSPSGVDLGGSFVFTETPSGGTGTYPGYAWTFAPSLGCSPSTTSTLRCSPTATGSSLRVSVIVTDSNGVASAAGSVSVNVSAPPRAAQPLATPGSLDVGQNVSFSSRTSGGAGALTYLWSGLPSGCLSVGNVSRCSPTAAGTFSITLQVTDANGVTATSPALVDVVDPALAAPTLQASILALHPGQTTVISASVSGGATPYSLSWSGLPTGCTAAANALSVRCVPSTAGEFTVSVSVADANGERTVSTGLLISVTSPPSSSPLTGLSGGTNGLLLLLALVGIALIVLLGLFLRRRRSSTARRASGEVGAVQEGNGGSGEELPEAPSDATRQADLVGSSDAAVPPGEGASEAPPGTETVPESEYSESSADAATEEDSPLEVTDAERPPEGA